MGPNVGMDPNTGKDDLERALGTDGCEGPFGYLLLVPRQVWHGRCPKPLQLLHVRVILLFVL